jgi:serine/threonine protein kinase
MGQPLGNCRIVRLIGEGGFGEVCLAKNPLIERRPADKVLHSALAQDAGLVLCAAFSSARGRMHRERLQ